MTTFDDLLVGNLPQPDPNSNVISLCGSLERSHLEHELRQPLLPGHAFFQISWEKVAGTPGANYQFALHLRDSKLMEPGLRKLGAHYDESRQVWTLPLLAREVLKSFLLEHQELLHELREIAHDEMVRESQLSWQGSNSTPEQYQSSLRGAHIVEASRRTDGLLRVADFLKNRGRGAKVRDVASLKGSCSLHYTRHVELGAKDQVLAYDYLAKRIWWCAGTNLDSYASFLPVQGAQAILFFLEQYHFKPSISICVPKETDLEDWLANSEK